LSICASHGVEPTISGNVSQKKNKTGKRKEKRVKIISKESNQRYLKDRETP
jgi:hypothetical protein